MMLNPLEQNTVSFGKTVPSVVILDHVHPQNQMPFLEGFALG